MSRTYGQIARRLYDELPERVRDRITLNFVDFQYVSVAVGYRDDHCWFRPVRIVYLDNHPGFPSDADLSRLCLEVG